MARRFPTPLLTTCPRSFGLFVHTSITRFQHFCSRGQAIFYTRPQTMQEVFRDLYSDCQNRFSDRKQTDTSFPLTLALSLGERVKLCHVFRRFNCQGLNPAPAFPTSIFIWKCILPIAIGSKHHFRQAIRLRIHGLGVCTNLPKFALGTKATNAG